ncbi:hypothetical protein [Methanobrevibacter sp.]|uniref:hypothetical protein n=1 Tax=Methanobrevibacter sp. TaxID=66852 RepID=UPI00388EE151
MKYPLQKEIEQNLKESTDYVVETINIPKAHEIAIKYYDAIKRIEKICSDRKRY